MKTITSEANSSGFTIMELLVTIIVSSILISSATLILTSHVHLAQRGRDTILANSFAEAKVESLRSVGFVGLVDGTTDITSELPAELKAPRSASLEISALTVAIKEIDLSITYNDQGAARNFSYTTHIGELGVGQY